MLFKCECGEEFETTFSSFKGQNKQQCNKCGIKIRSRKKKLSYEEVKKFIEVESDSGCNLLSKEYINNSSKMLLECSCGNKFEVSFTKFKDRNKRQCNKCSNKNRANKLKRTMNEFKKEVYERVGDEYVVVEGEVYVNSKINIRMKHNLCGHIWNVTPDSFLLKSTGCPKCNRPNYYRDTKQFKKEVSTLTNGEYQVLGEYKSARDKTLIRHNIKECGYEWDITPDNFLSGTRCPQCNASKGEEKIRLYIESCEINYKIQYSFDNLIGINGGLLKFDFAIFDFNNNLLFLIEYDGEFHFEKQYDYDGFETLQIHDGLKNQYCKDNKIELLRIPYWEFDNIESIIQNQLDDYKEVFCETS